MLDECWHVFRCCAIQSNDSMAKNGWGARERVMTVCGLDYCNAKSRKCGQELYLNSTN